MQALTSRPSLHADVVVVRASAAAEELRRNAPGHIGWGGLAAGAQAVPDDAEKTLAPSSGNTWITDADDRAAA